MSNSLKIVNKAGYTKNIMNVISCKYKQEDGIMDLEVVVHDMGDNTITSEHAEDYQLVSGDVAYLVNSYGTTVDTIRIK